MSPSFLFQVAAVIAVSIGGSIYLAENSPMSDKSEMSQTDVTVKTPARPRSASVVSIPRSNGQFFTQGRVNSGSVRFLVDTGASTVALTLTDAKRAGIDTRRLIYSAPVQTANGRNMAAPVTLKDVRIGGVRVQNVDALVLKEGLHVSLLGMTFLGELQKVEATPTQLILRR